MENTFFATLFRMKYISRWGLMRCNFPENLAEHSLEVAFLAHALALIGNRVFGKSYDCGAVCVKAMYHDAPEILTGDLPTPVKYKTPGIQDAYAAVEADARSQLMDMLPEDMRPAFRPFVDPNQTTYEWRLVKAADRISAYLKCIEEEKMGNRDFAHAKLTIYDSISQNPLPEVHEFMREFVPSFSLTPDELSRSRD